MKYLTNDSFNSLFKPFGGWFDGATPSVMRTDVKASDKEYILSVDLPGVDKKNIELGLQDGYLTIEATRSPEPAEENGNFDYVVREKTYGKMTRSFYVGDGIKEENVKAKYENGILTVIVPKYREEEKTLRKISVD